MVVCGNNPLAGSAGSFESCVLRWKYRVEVLSVFTVETFHTFKIVVESQLKEVFSLRSAAGTSACGFSYIYITDLFSVLNLQKGKNNPCKWERKSLSYSLFCFLWETNFRFKLFDCVFKWLLIYWTLMKMKNVRLFGGISFLLIINNIVWVRSDCWIIFIILMLLVLYL